MNYRKGILKFYAFAICVSEYTAQNVRGWKTDFVGLRAIDQSDVVLFICSWSSPWDSRGMNFTQDF